MKRFLTALALLGCLAGVAHGDYLMIRVNLGIPPLPPKEKPKNAPGGFMMGPGGIPMMIPNGGIQQPGMPSWMQRRDPKSRPPRTKGDKVKQVAASSGPPVAVVVFVEFKRGGKDIIDPNLEKTYTPIRHKWGLTYLAFDQHIVEIRALTKKPSLAQRYKDLRDDVFRPGNRTPRKLLELAEWTLVHNVVAEKRDANDQPGFEFPNVMAELLKLEATVNEPDIRKALEAYKKVTADLQKPIDKDDAKYWKEKLGLGKVTRSDHYVLLYDSDGGKAPPEVVDRLKRLEQNYQLYYSWFALRGLALAPPDKKLVAALVDSPAEFRRQHEAFDAVPIVADGLYARRENIVVFSGSRLDGASDAFNKHISDLVRSGWDFKALLRGKGRRGKDNAEVAYAQTMALVHKCLQEESELATVSHEGTRQLLTATGFLPRGVLMPEWLQFGLPSAFETPKYDPFTRTGAFYPLFAGPSWTYLINFKLMDQEKRLKGKELDNELKGILTDSEFREATLSSDPFAQLRARTMAWSLCYYLVQRRLDGLRRYGQELAKLPRDLEFDDAVHINCFARAFGLEDPKQPGQIDPAKLHEFAADWHQFIAETTPVPMKEMLKEAEDALKEYRDKTGLKGPSAG